MCAVDPETKKEFEEMQSKGPISGSNGAASQSLSQHRSLKYDSRADLDFSQYKISISRAGWQARAQELAVAHQEQEVEVQVKENDCLHICTNFQRHLATVSHTAQLYAEISTSVDELTTH